MPTGLPAPKCLRRKQVSALKRAFAHAKLGGLPKVGWCKRLARGLKGTQGEVCHDAYSSPGTRRLRHCYYLIGADRYALREKLRQIERMNEAAKAGYPVFTLRHRRVDAAS